MTGLASSSRRPAPAYTTDSETTDEDSLSHPTYGDEHDIAIDGVNAKADDNFYAADAEYDAWLATHPGGLPKLYPHLFVVTSSRGLIVTPAEDPSEPLQLPNLPQEVKNMIYLECMLDVVETDAPSDVNRLWTVQFDLDDGAQLKALLTSPILQTSRQSRFEALPEFFRNIIFTTSWLPDLAKFSKFLDHAGRNFVRNLTLTDDLNLKHQHPYSYMCVMRELQAFKRLDYLSIVLVDTHPNMALSPSEVWFDADDLDNHGNPKAQARPKMRLADFGEDTPGARDMLWPEYAILEEVSTQEFVMVFDSAVGRFLFDENVEAMADLKITMAENRAADTSPTSITEPRRLRSFGRPPPTQASDNLKDKTIPLYNFVREVLELWDRHSYFPMASHSKGVQMLDCGLCYICGQHCGYHVVPKDFRHEITANDFKNATPEDIEEEADAVVVWLRTSEYHDPLLRIGAIQRYLGWPRCRPSDGASNVAGPSRKKQKTGNANGEANAPVWDVVVSAMSSAYGPRSVA